MQKKKRKQKCFISFLYHISFIFYEKVFFLLYFLRKKKYWLNFGFFLPKITNESFNYTFYKNLISLKMDIPEGFVFDFIRSRIGRIYFRFFFKFFNSISYFSFYFFSFYKQIQKTMKIRLKYRLKSRLHSRYFLRFFKFENYLNELKELQKTFNFFFYNKLSKTFLKKKQNYFN